MCSKPRLVALFATALLFIGLTKQVVAADGSALYGKTYHLYFNVNGKQVGFRFYISNQGEVYSFSNNSGSDCSSTGSFTKLNSSNQTSYSCATPGYQTRFTVNNRARAVLSGGVVTYQDPATVVSRGTSTVTTRYNTSFSTDGSKCQALSYSVNGGSFSPISCEVTAGKG